MTVIVREFKIIYRVSIELLIGTISQLSHEVGGGDSTLGIDVELDFHQILLDRSN